MLHGQAVMPAVVKLHVTGPDMAMPPVSVPPDTVAVYVAPACSVAVGPKVSVREAAS